MIDALALALLAAAAFDVEAEAARLVAALDRERRLREEVADGVVEADVGRRVRTAVASDRRLVDVHHLVHVLEAVDAVVLAGQRARVHQPLPERLVEDLVDQRALARTRRAGDRDQLAEREGRRRSISGCSRARRARSASCHCPLRRFAGVAIDRLPERNCPVGDALHLRTSSSVPCTTTVPP